MMLRTANLLLWRQHPHDIAPGLGPVGQACPEAAAQLHTLIRGSFRQQLEKLQKLGTLHVKTPSAWQSDIAN